MWTRDPRHIESGVNLFTRVNAQCGSAVSCAKHSNEVAGCPRQFYQQKKHSFLSALFWRLPADSDPRHIESGVNLFTRVNAQCGPAVSCAKHSNEVAGCPRQFYQQKKHSFLSALFWRLLRDSDPRHCG